MLNMFNKWLQFFFQIEDRLYKIALNLISKCRMKITFRKSKSSSNSNNTFRIYYLNCSIANSSFYYYYRCTMKHGQQKSNTPDSRPELSSYRPESELDIERHYNLRERTSSPQINKLLDPNNSINSDISSGKREKAIDFNIDNLIYQQVNSLINGLCLIVIALCLIVMCCTLSDLHNDLIMSDNATQIEKQENNFDFILLQPIFKKNIQKYRTKSTFNIHHHEKLGKKLEQIKQNVIEIAKSRNIKIPSNATNLENVNVILISSNEELTSILVLLEEIKKSFLKNPK